MVVSVSNIVNCEMCIKICTCAHSHIAMRRDANERREDLCIPSLAFFFLSFSCTGRGLQLSVVVDDDNDDEVIALLFKQFLLGTTR